MSPSWIAFTLLFSSACVVVSPPTAPSDHLGDAAVDVDTGARPGSCDVAAVEDACIPDDAPGWQAIEDALVFAMETVTLEDDGVDFVGIASGDRMLVAQGPACAGVAPYDCAAPLSPPDGADGLFIFGLEPKIELGRLIVSSDGVASSVTEIEALLEVVGPVDSAGDAILLLLTEGGGVPPAPWHPQRVRARADGIEVVATHHTSWCAPILTDQAVFAIDADGSIATPCRRQVQCREGCI
jgi:hypothetical protein